MPDSKKNIGDRSRDIRLKLNLTQGAFAKSIELTPAAYSSIERGKSGYSMATLQLLDEKFNVDLNWLLAGKRSMFVEERSQAAEEADIYAVRQRVEKLEITIREIQQGTVSKNQTIP